LLVLNVFFPDYYNICFGAMNLESKMATTACMKRPMAVMCTIRLSYFSSPIKLLWNSDYNIWEIIINLTERNDC